MTRKRTRFRDRQEAGRQLAELLGHLTGDVVVLGLPRGGVPVAHEVAGSLRAPLDVLLVRKLGVPMQPELAMGAIGEGGAVIRNEEVLSRAGVSETAWRQIVRQEKAELSRQQSLFRGDRAPATIAGRTAVIVDDGIATGSTVQAACRIARERSAARVIVAAPVAPSETVEELRTIADEVVTVAIPDPFLAIGLFYDDFHQVSDAEVKALFAGDHGFYPDG